MSIAPLSSMSGVCGDINGVVAAPSRKKRRKQTCQRQVRLPRSRWTIINGVRQRALHRIGQIDWVSDSKASEGIDGRALRALEVAICRSALVRQFSGCGTACREQYGMRA